MRVGGIAHLTVRDNARFAQNVSDNEERRLKCSGKVPAPTDSVSIDLGPEPRVGAWRKGQCAPNF